MLHAKRKLKIKISKNFRHRVNTVVTVGLAAGVLALLALTTSPGNESSVLPTLTSQAQATQESTAEHIAEARAREENEKKLLAHHELYRQLVSGTRTSAELESEIRDLAGSSEGLEFSKAHINRAYKLSMILTSYKMSGGNAFDVLFIHSFAQNGLPEDAVTLYTRRIDGMEENMASAGIAVSRNIEIQSDGTPSFNAKYKGHYLFGLERSAIKRAYDLRDPEGLGGFAPLSNEAFDPLALLTRGNAVFENGAYREQLLATDGKIYDVSIQIRKTEIGTLTFEVHLQEAGSPILKTFVLVYEEL